MIHCISLRCGYVESGQAGRVIFVNANGFKTSGEALQSLAKGLYDKYTENFYDNRHKNCCQKTLAKVSKAKFCSDCGKNLREPEFDVRRYQDWIINFGNQTADSIGGEEISDGRDGIWDPWLSFKELRKLKDKEVLEITHCAESVLIDAGKDYLPKDTDLSEIGYLPEEYTELYSKSQPQDCAE